MLPPPPPDGPPALYDEWAGAIDARLFVLRQLAQPPRAARVDNRDPPVWYRLVPPLSSSLSLSSSSSSPRLPHPPAMVEAGTAAAAAVGTPAAGAAATGTTPSVCAAAAATATVAANDAAAATDAAAVAAAADAAAAAADAAAADAAIHDYFHASVDAAALMERFAATDARFAAVAPALRGSRLLRTPPTEALFSFLCTPQCQLARSSALVHHLARAYGTPAPRCRRSAQAGKKPAAAAEAGLEGARGRSRWRRPLRRLAPANRALDHHVRGL